MTYLFEEFPKIPRLKREVVITEKIDGTNAQIAWVEIAAQVMNGEQTLVIEYNPEWFREDPLCLGVYPGAKDGDSAMALYAGSRSRWITAEKDNYGFAKWVLKHAEELRALGPGRHYGEWYGLGIQRGYDLPEKRFALFNVARWNPENPNKPACCDVVPILARGDDVSDDQTMRLLNANGSYMVPGYNQPEGIVIWHSASRQLYKRTFRDDGGKWKPALTPLPQFAPDTGHTKVFA
jgi:hypothetical protein